MASKNRRSTWKWVLCASFLSVGCVAAVYLLLHTERKEENLVNSTTCEIRFIDRDQRLRPPLEPPLPKHFIRPYAPIVIPPDQAENPVIEPHRFAVVQFKNTGNQPFVAYEVLQPMYRDPTARDAFIVDVEVRDSTGAVLDGRYPPQDSLLSIMPPEVPPATELLARNPTTRTLNPGEVIDLQMSILGKVVSPKRGLKPGTYTVRATVSYAEAPSGETKRVTTEPVTVVVTAEHIKAAEEFWKANGIHDKP